MRVASSHNISWREGRKKKKKKKRKNLASGQRVRKVGLVYTMSLENSEDFVPPFEMRPWQKAALHLCKYRKTKVRSDFIISIKIINILDLYISSCTASRGSLDQVARFALHFDILQSQLHAATTLPILPCIFFFTLNYTVTHNQLNRVP